MAKSFQNSPGIVVKRREAKPWSEVLGMQGKFEICGLAVWPPTWSKDGKLPGPRAVGGFSV